MKYLIGKVNLLVFNECNAKIDIFKYFVKLLGELLHELDFLVDANEINLIVNILKVYFENEVHHD